MATQPVRGIGAIPIVDKLRVAHAAGTAQQLVALDGIWDVHASTVGRENVNELVAVVHQMDSLLGSLATQGPFIAQVARTIGDDGINRIVDTAPALSDAVRSAKALLQREGGGVAATEKRMQQVVAAERNDLSQQLGRLRGGSSAKGDLSQTARCIIGFICLFSEAPPIQAAGIGLIATSCGE